MKKSLLTATVTVITILSMFFSCTESADPIYSVSYDSNGATSGNAPIDSKRYHEGDLITILSNTGNLVKSGGFTFAGWNVLVSGLGDNYTAGQTLTIGSADLILYAKWAPVYTITYNGNGFTQGNLPVDNNAYQAGQTITILNATNLLKIVSNDATYKLEKWNTATNGSGVDYTISQSYPMIADNLTLYAVWKEIGLRDRGPAGGLIFYDKGSYSSGWRYLEAAPNDQSAGYYWSTMDWGSPLATSTAIGSGQANTDLIISQGYTTAAKLCNSYTNGPYSDWFLPSDGELNNMLLNLADQGVGGFTTGTGVYYWSSSEADASSAYRRPGTVWGSKAIDLHRVRAARSF